MMWIKKWISATLRAMQNEVYFVKVQGKANIPNSLSIGHNYKLTADCSITSEQKNDNEDGTFDIVYRVEPITVEIQKDNGPITKAKDPRKVSQKIRNYLYRCYCEEECSESFEEVYSLFGNVVMSHTETLLRETLKKINERKNG